MAVSSSEVKMRVLSLHSESQCPRICVLVNKSNQGAKLSQVYN